MAVLKRAYKPYDGPLTSERWRFLVLPRYALRELLESRVIVVFLVLCFVPFLAETGMIYLASVPAARALLGITEDQNPFRIGADFFLWALTVQGASSFFLTAWIGPVLVSPDLANGALPLYLSRPFSRVEYVLGKATVLIALLSLITWVQGLVLFSLHAGLVGRDWLFSNLRIAGAIFVGAWIWIAVLTLLGLAFSSWIKWRLVATGALFAVFFGGAAFSEVWHEVLRNSWGRLVHLPYLIQIVWRDLFDSASVLGRGGRDLPTWAAWAGLLAVCLLCVRLLSRRLLAREVVP